MVWRVFKILLTVLFMQCVTVLSALALTPAIDYELWDKQAKYAERQLENGEVSESLRKQIAEWRSVLLTASEANKNAISTLEAQIEALGPVPDEGVEDPLADRRNELSLQLAELKAPSAKAREAFQRADGLIKKIDQTIRTEQASRLIHLGPSPLNVTAWTTALTDLNAFQRGLQRKSMQPLPHPVACNPQRSGRFTFHAYFAFAYFDCCGTHADRTIFKGDAGK